MNSALDEAQRTAQAITVTGIGLITGLPVTVTLQPGAPGAGIVFRVPAGDPIPARLDSIAVTDRGVTLANRQGQTLSIVEHFLSACAMAGVADIVAAVDGAPELPVLDGSAQPWLEALRPLAAPDAPRPQWELSHAVFHRHSEDIALYAIPAERCRFTYAVDFDHPGLRQAFVTWDPQAEGPEAVAPARTFGHVRELPLLQARGLAKGVSFENTLGLTDEGAYTDALRLADEPARHKLLDFVGDLMLTGINPLTVKAHWFAVNAGHASHTAFGKKLLAGRVLQKI